MGLWFCECVRLNSGKRNGDLRSLKILHQGIAHEEAGKNRMVPGGIVTPLAYGI